MLEFRMPAGLCDAHVPVSVHAHVHTHVRVPPHNNAAPCVCRWFQESASRSAAEELLRLRDVGQFVIRGCQSTPGGFSISVRWGGPGPGPDPGPGPPSRGHPGDQDRALNPRCPLRHESDVQHFKVMSDHRGQYFLWSKKFTSLNKLVEFYKTASISKTREIYLDDGGADAKAPPPAQSVGPTNPPEHLGSSHVSADS